MLQYTRLLTPWHAHMFSLTKQQTMTPHTMLPCASILMAALGSFHLCRANDVM
jgi:hypothetical protein